MEKQTSADAIREKQDLEDVVACATAATKLQLEKIRSLSFTDCIFYVDTLVAENREIPDLHKLHITKLFVATRVTEVSVGTWALYVVPRMAWCPTESREWFVRLPLFRCCRAHQMDVDSREFKAAVELWPSMVFNDSFWDHLNAAPKSMALRLKLSYWCATLIANLQPSLEFVTDDFKPVVRSACSALRAAAGLSNPEPNFCSVTLDDVRYIMPGHSTKAKIADDMPKNGRAIASKFRKDPFWAEMLTEFEETCGASFTIGSAISDMKKTMKEAVVNIEKMQASLAASALGMTPRMTDHQDFHSMLLGNKDVLVKFQREMPVWIKHRPGATDQVRAVAASLLATVAPLLLSNVKADALPFLTLMQDLLCEDGLCKNESLCQQIVDELLTSSSQQSAAQVEAVCGEIMVADDASLVPRDLVTLSSHLAARPSLSDSASQTVGQVCVRLMGFLANKEQLEHLKPIKAIFHGIPRADSNFQAWENALGVLIHLQDLHATVTEWLDSAEDASPSIGSSLRKLSVNLKTSMDVLRQKEAEMTEHKEVFQQFLIFSVVPSFDIIRRDCCDAVTRYSAALITNKVRLASDQLAPICQGGVAGEKWSDAKTADVAVMDWAETSLCGIDQERIATFHTGLREVFASNNTETKQNKN